MSKCKYVILNGLGKCQLWIILYRNNINNVSMYYYWKENIKYD